MVSYCPNCGKKLENEAAPYCPYCGNPVTVAPKPAPPLQETSLPNVSGILEIINAIISGIVGIISAMFIGAIIEGANAALPEFIVLTIFGFLGFSLGLIGGLWH
jgi:DNA-directed RNA polymerase subunit RPC12/RpoP